MPVSKPDRLTNVRYSAWKKQEAKPKSQAKLELEGSALAARTVPDDMTRRDMTMAWVANLCKSRASRNTVRSGARRLIRV